MTGRVIVLGAGMVGVSTGLALLRRGFSVTILDRREPGSETSYGNAGILSSGSMVPLNAPSLWGSLPRYLTNRHPALRYNLGFLASHPAWPLRFLAHATSSQVERSAIALHGLLQASLKLHRSLIVEAGATHRLRETGWLKLWRSDNLEAAKAEQATLARYGVRSEIFDRQGISALEPDINPIFSVGLLHQDTASVDAPGAVTKAYAALFAREGGRIETTDIKTISQAGEEWRVITSSGEHSAPHLVVALGPWSADMLAQLGYRFPLGFERGYHREFRAADGRKLSRPLHDVEGAFVLTPVENGFRITSGVELNARDAAPNFNQIELAEKSAEDIMPFGAPVGDVWRGARPTLPDSLPAIGRAPRHDRLWVAFGHQHIGFTTGPATGDALATLIAGEKPSFDISAFSPSRFG
ncbi:FAD-binding oxidoreductase [Terrarubrum flagellatum]|uniref:NAD(P)/FAD-dependent oxidoreductase n=1 Tax=Terrirubrum flagellatum TaxID=2895980 RepID=UPI0031455B92